MRTPALAALLVLAAAGLAFAGAPPAKPAASPAAKPSKKPAEKPPEKAPEPAKDECVGVSAKDGAVLATATNGDYQGCLRQIKEGVKAKACDGSASQVSFVFHRGGQKAITQSVACN